MYVKRSLRHDVFKMMQEIQVLYVYIAFIVYCVTLKTVIPI